MTEESPEQPEEELTAKEKAMKLIEEGLDNKSIAQETGLSESRISQIRGEMLGKTVAQYKEVLSQEEVRNILELRPEVLKKRAIEMYATLKMIGAGKEPPEAPVKAAERPVKKSFMDELTNGLERITEIQVVAQKFGVDPMAFMGRTGNPTFAESSDPLKTMERNLAILTLQKQIDRMTGPEAAATPQPAPLTLEQVRSAIKEEVGEREAAAEKERLKEELGEARHRNEVLDERLKQLNERIEKLSTAKPTPDTETWTKLMEAKIDAARAETEKDFQGQRITQLETKLQQIESAPPKKGFMDVIGEKLEPKLEEKLTEMIEKGFISKEEVIEAKTGKINWGRVIERAFDMAGKTLERASKMPPPERQIIPVGPDGKPLSPEMLQRVAGYTPPQTSSTPQTPSIPEAPAEGQPTTVKIGYGVEASEQASSGTGETASPQQTEGGSAPAQPVPQPSSPGPTRTPRKPRTREKA